MSQASTLELPEWLSAAVRAEPASTVVGQSVAVNRAWWRTVGSVHHSRTSSWSRPTMP
jgi:hypothetical protein